MAEGEVRLPPDPSGEFTPVFVRTKIEHIIGRARMLGNSLAGNDPSAEKFELVGPQGSTLRQTKTTKRGIEVSEIMQEGEAGFSVSKTVTDRHNMTQGILVKPEGDILKARFIYGSPGQPTAPLHEAPEGPIARATVGVILSGMENALINVENTSAEGLTNRAAFILDIPVEQLNQY